MIKAILKFIYKVLSFINLQPALFVSLIGALLFFTGVLTAHPLALLIFQLALIATLIYALIKTIFNLLGLNKKVKKSKGAQIMDTDKQQTDNQSSKGEDIGSNDNPDDYQKENGGLENTVNLQKPKYFRVKNNPNMLMAEFSDRYELYEIQGENLIKIRTDYKG